MPLFPLSFLPTRFVMRFYFFPTFFSTTLPPLLHPIPAPSLYYLSSERRSGLAKLVWQEELLNIILGNRFPIASGLCFKVNRHCISTPLCAHQMGWQNWQLVKLATTRMEMEAPTTSPGCQTKKRSRMKVNIWKSLKIPAFFVSNQPHPWPANYHLLLILPQPLLLNVITSLHPYGNTEVQITNISHSYSLTGLPAADVAVLGH